MPHTLLLRLPAPGHEDTEWLGIDAAGEPESARQRGPLTLAAAVGRSARVVVLASATQILLAEPELPPGSGVRLARAVPFALEEQLTEDVDKLVFALGKRRDSGGTPVAVVSRAVLQGWLADLSAAGIEPVALYPDMSLLPANPAQTILWLEGGRLSVRRPGKLPFAVELAPVTDALIVAGVIADPLAAADAHILESAILYATREDWARVQDEFEGLVGRFASLNVQLLPDGPLPWLARSISGTDAVNLLQGEFARTQDYSVGLRRWRTAAGLAAALLVVHMAADAVQLRQAKREAATLDEDIAQLFASVMPGAELRDPRRQMQTRLERIRHSGPGAQHFLRTLEVMSGALATAPNTSIEAMSFRDEALDLTLTAPSLAALSQVSQWVGRRGLTAEIQSSTPVGNNVQAHMQIRSGAPRARQ